MNRTNSLRSWGLNCAVSWSATTLSAKPSCLIFRGLRNRASGIERFIEPLEVPVRHSRNKIAYGPGIVAARHQLPEHPCQPRHRMLPALLQSHRRIYVPIQELLQLTAGLKRGI